MDTQAVDQAYGQLQTEFQDVAKSVQTLVEKPQAGAQGGDTDAREWLLDLKQGALDVKDEQMQANALLQAIHQYVSESHDQLQQQVPQYQQMPQMGAGMGAGFGLGDDLINSIF